MNLEHLEARAVAYLNASPRPLVPLKALVRHLHEDPIFAAAPEQAIEDFLEHHESFHVVAPALPAIDTPNDRQFGFAPEPYIILKTRVPTNAEMVLHLREELGRLLEALESARNEASNNQDESRVREVDGMIERAQNLRDKLTA